MRPEDDLAPDRRGPRGRKSALSWRFFRSREGALKSSGEEWIQCTAVVNAPRVVMPGRCAHRCALLTMYTARYGVVLLFIEKVQLEFL